MAGLDGPTNGGGPFHRPCTANPFCHFVGPFHEGRLFAFTPRATLFVGGCWAESLDHPGEPSRYVCSRCAHRREAYRAGPGQTLWQLCCPFDGIPLGHGKESVVIDGGGVVLKTFDELPHPADLDLVLARARGPVPETAEGLLSAAIESFEKTAFVVALELAERVCRMEPDNDIARTVGQRCLERLGRPADALRFRDRPFGLERRHA